MPSNINVLNASFLLFLFSIVACSEQNSQDNSPPPPNPENAETFNYELKDSSIMKVPYNGKNRVVFVDSFENELTFVIQENEVKTRNLSNYNKELDQCETPYWTEQSKEFKLINDSLDLTFIVELKTDLDLNGSHPKKFCDKLFLWALSYPDNEEKDISSEKIIVSRRALFQCVVDERTSIYSSHWEPIDSLTILGRTFYAILGEESANDHSILFNFEYGILSFQDYQSKIWRFSHFPD